MAFAAFHIYVASTLTSPFVIYYVGGLLIPITIMMVAKLLTNEVNTNWVRTKYHHWTTIASTTIHPLSHNQPNKVIMQADTGDSPLPPSTMDLPLVFDLESNPLVHNPYTTRLSLHLHHWQIFYILAYFTR